MILFVFSEIAPPAAAQDHSNQKPAKRDTTYEETGQAPKKARAKQNPLESDPEPSQSVADVISIYQKWTASFAGNQNFTFYINSNYQALMFGQTGVNDNPDIEGWIVKQ